MSEKNILSQEEIDALLKYPEEHEIFLTKAELETVVNVTIQLAQAQMTLADLMQLQAHDFLELNKMLEEPLDLLIQGEIIAQGYVKVGKNNKVIIQLHNIVDKNERVQQVMKE